MSLSFSEIKLLSKANLSPGEADKKIKIEKGKMGRQ